MMCKKTIILAAMGCFAMAGLAGCGSPTREEASTQANARWHQTRAAMLLSVGEEQFRIGDLGNARNSAREAISLVPELIEAHLLLVRVEIEEGNYATAMRHLDATSPEGNEPAVVCYLKGVVLERRRQYDESLRQYERARALDPSNVAYVLASAEVLASLGRPDEGLKVLEAKMDLLDPTPGMHKAAGELALLAGLPDKAIVHFNQARSSGVEDLVAQEGLARAYFFAGRYDRAIRLLEDLIEEQSYSHRPSLFTMLGESHLASNRPREARGYFEQAVNLDRNNYHHWVNLSKAALAAGDSHRAILAAREAQSIRPEMPEASLLLASALLSDGKAEAAQNVLEPMTRTHSDQPMLACLLGRSYDIMGDTGLARQWYLAALRIEPENALAQALLAAADAKVGP